MAILCGLDPSEAYLDLGIDCRLLQPWSAAAPPLSNMTDTAALRHSNSVEPMPDAKMRP
jgi:hypothetical protein